jgi:TolB-like protein
MSLFSELKRRNVFRVAAGYAVLSWLVLQITDVLVNALELAPGLSKTVVAILVIGLVPALVLSWIYEMTPAGLKKESEIRPENSVTAHTAAKLDKAVIVLLVLAIGMFAADRFMSAPEPATDLVTDAALTDADARVQVGAEASALDASVAVLPFTTRSSGSDDGFFSDGVHDDLLTQLAKIGELRVISRTSVMEYRDTTKNMRQIGQELGVATIVEGAVQRSGSMVRITAQLIDTATDEHLWAETYDRELTASNLFAIQTEIATSIAGALQATLSPEEQQALDRQLTDDLQALEAYQRARRSLASFRLDVIQNSLAELDFAVERDPGFAAAYALRARYHMWNFWALETDPIYLQRAWADIEAARAIDPGLPEADIAEGIYHYWGFLDYPAALAVLEPTLLAYPNDSDLLSVVSWVNRRYGRFDTALALMRRAIAVDPRNIDVRNNLAETLLQMGEYEEVPSIIAAMDAIRRDEPRTLAVRASLAEQRDGDPENAARYWSLVSTDLSYAHISEFVQRMAAGQFDRAVALADRVGTVLNRGFTATARMLRGLALHAAGDPTARSTLEAARAELEAILAEDPETGEHAQALCQVVGALHDTEAAIEICERGLRDVGRDAFDHYRYYVVYAARGLAMAGEHDRAFELLEDAITQRVGPRRNTLRLDPLLSDLHDDPRWEALIAAAPL